MSELTIRLVFNKKTGKKDIHIDYESEDDALPIEHEHEHKALVEKLIGQKILGPDEVGVLVVTRERPQPAARQGEAKTQAEPQAQGQA